MCDTNTKEDELKLMMKYLEIGADIDGGLSCASFYGDIVLVKYFVGKGALNFESAYRQAIHRGHADVAKYLSDHYLTKTTGKERMESIFFVEMVENILKGNVDLVKMMIRSRPELDIYPQPKPGTSAGRKLREKEWLRMKENASFDRLASFVKNQELVDLFRGKSRSAPRPYKAIPRDRSF